MWYPSYGFMKKALVAISFGFVVLTVTFVTIGGSLDMIGSNAAGLLSSASSWLQTRLGHGPSSQPRGDLLRGYTRIVLGRPKGGDLRNKLDWIPFPSSSRIVSPRGAFLRESVTQRTGYAETSEYDSQHKSVR